MPRTKEYMTVAATIRSQIMSGMGPVIPMSWGFETPIGMPPNKGMRGGALKFKVSGRKHKGWVLVELTAMDDYTVTLFDTNGNPVGTPREGIYCDVLAEVIDRMVET